MRCAALYFSSLSSFSLPLLRRERARVSFSLVNRYPAGGTLYTPEPAFSHTIAARDEIILYTYTRIYTRVHAILYNRVILRALSETSQRISLSLRFSFSFGASLVGLLECVCVYTTVPYTSMRSCAAADEKKMNPYLQQEAC